MTFFRLIFCFLLLIPLAYSQELKTPIRINTDPNSTQWSSRRNTPLLTAWGRAVSPWNVHPDYPRPTLARKEWLNLNGLWDWKHSLGTAGTEANSNFDGRILVPFPIESTLSGVGISIEQMTYRRFFIVPAQWHPHHRILLHFGAVDWETTVYINGKLVGRHRGGYDPFSFDITDFIHPARETENEIIVQVYDPTNQGQQPRGKQVTSPSGVWYSSVTGIWQTVWLEPVPENYLQSIHLSPDLDSGVLAITPRINVPKSTLSLFVEALDGDEVVAKAYGGVDGPILLRFPKEKLKLWSPDSPFLYQLRICLMDRETTIDQVASYTAFRKVDLARNALGNTRIRLNGRFYFQMGVIDHGYWPDGLYTPPSDHAIHADILVAKKLGFNMIRKHAKVESERWYHWCDRIGMLVWQDMPSGENRAPEAQEEFKSELQRIILARNNHPAIIVWTLFNEGWGQHQTSAYVNMVRNLDPTRLINNASGWTDYGEGHIKDHHKFPGPELLETDPDRASVIGSFGGLTLVPPKAHLWTTDTWGYQHVQDSNGLIKQYRSMHAILRSMIREEGLSAAAFHQLVDVESECNGLTSYDRAILKIPSEMMHQINHETISYGSSPVNSD